jgi:hypothetical protein
MTSTITPEDTGDVGARTINIAPYIDGMRPVRRPDASGEWPIITGTRPVGAAELARLAATTLILPDGPALPPALPAAQTVVVSESLREKNYRGRHRAGRSPWRWALAGAGTLLVGQLLALACTVALSAAVR